VNTYWRLTRLVVLSSILAVSAGPLLSASLPGTEQRIVASDDDNSDWFGRSVDVFGDFAVVGAPGDDEEANGAGAAYVFRRQGGSWSEIQKLTAETDAEQFDEFGFDVAIERDLIAIGAPGDDTAGGDAGAVYLFEWDGSSWTRIEKFVPDDISNSAYAYGTAVDIGIAIPADGTVEIADVVVGAPNADQSQGVVFLNERIGSVWTMNQGRFSDSDSTPGMNNAGNFGTSVAIRGDNLIAGAPADDQFGGNSGAAYLFGRTGSLNVWSEVEQYYPSSPTGGERFGLSVALGDSVVVIGAPAPSPSGSVGQVYVYSPSLKVFTEGDATDEYGSSVAIDESRNLIVVGSKRDDEVAAKAGAVYLLERNNLDVWQAGGKVLASDAAINKEFGEAVAIQGNTVVVGGGEEDAFTSGAAYVYSSRLFADGFESGDSAAWSVTLP